MIRKCRLCNREWIVSILAQPLRHYVCPVCKKKEVQGLKHGKKPTNSQKHRIKSFGLNPDNWLVVKDCAVCFEVVNRTSGKVRRF